MTVVIDDVSSAANLDYSEVKLVYLRDGERSGWFVWDLFNPFRIYDLEFGALCDGTVFFKAGHKLLTGDVVVLDADETQYFVAKIDDQSFSLASSADDAYAGVVGTFGSQSFNVKRVLDPFQAIILHTEVNSQNNQFYALVRQDIEPAKLEWWTEAALSNTDRTARINSAIHYCEFFQIPLHALSPFYQIDQTVVFRGKSFGAFDGQHVFSHCTKRQFTRIAGFLWEGGNDTAIVEVQDCFGGQWDALRVTNNNSATGLTGVLIHNVAAGGAAINFNNFDLITVKETCYGVKLGDFTGDGYQSKCDDMNFGDIMFWRVANGLIFDSGEQDNIIINYLTNVGVAVEPRNHVVHSKRNGRGNVIRYMFLRADGIEQDSSVVLIEDGALSCDYYGVEPGNTQQVRVLDITASDARDGMVWRNVSTPRNFPMFDSNGVTIHVGPNSNVLLENVAFRGAGNILVEGFVTSINASFAPGHGFTLSGESAQVTEVGTACFDVSDLRHRKSPLSKL